MEIIEKKPNSEEEEKKGRCPRNKWYFKAVEHLKQARRCEQAAYRIGIKDKEENHNKQEEYRSLNEAAYEAVARRIDVHDEEERCFVNNNNCRRLALGRAKNEALPTTVCND